MRMMRFFATSSSTTTSSSVAGCWSEIHIDLFVLGLLNHATFKVNKTFISVYITFSIYVLNIQNINVLYIKYIFVSTTHPGTCVSRDSHVGSSRCHRSLKLGLIVKTALLLILLLRCARWTVALRRVMFWTTNTQQYITIVFNTQWGPISFLRRV